MSQKTHGEGKRRPDFLAELGPFQGYATTTKELGRIFRQIKAGEGFEHPVWDRTQANPLAKPTLVFDLERIEARMQRLNQLVGEHSVTALLAAKSGPDPRYLGLGRQYLGGFDVSNLAEYEALPSPLEGMLVSITSPDLEGEFDRFLSKGNTAVVVLDGQSQLDEFFRRQSSIPFLLRVSSSDLLRGDRSHEEDEVAQSRFGFTVERVHQLLRGRLASGRRPEGFHLHDGSEVNQRSTYLSMISGLGSLARQAAFQPKVINLGGGFHNISAEEMGDILKAARREFPPPCSLVVEPGRYFAQEAGFGIGRIVHQETCGDLIRFTVNLSNECHLKWSNVKLVCPVMTKARKLKEVQVFGPSCYEGDRIGRFLLPFQDHLQEESGLLSGRPVFFSGVSTYSAAWNTSFNGIPKADIKWWRGSREIGGLVDDEWPPKP